jgi:hypothetical protein
VSLTGDLFSSEGLNSAEAASAKTAELLFSIALSRRILGCCKRCRAPPMIERAEGGRSADPAKKENDACRYT